MKRSRWLSVVVMALAFPMLTGCWDRLEIEDRGTILGLAIDPVESTQPIASTTGPHAKSDLRGYRITAQIAIPGRIPLGPGEGTSGGQTEKPVWVITTRGKTIDDAMNRMQQEVADKIFLGHLRVIIVNQEIAKSVGMHDIQDFFRRNAEIRRLAWMVISTGDAKNAMEAAPKLERVPTLYLVGTMDHAVQLGKLPEVFLGNYWSTLSSQGEDPILPFIRVKGNDRIETRGVALFRGYKMVGWLNPTELAAYMEIKGVQKAGIGVATPITGDTEHSLIGHALFRKTKINLTSDNGKPAFLINSYMDGIVEEKTGRQPINQAMEHANQAFEKVLQTGQSKLIQKLQTLHTDPVGFGEIVRANWPTYWNSKIGTREKWEEEFSTIPIQSHAKVVIRRYGMSAK